MHWMMTLGPVCRTVLLMLTLAVSACDQRSSKTAGSIPLTTVNIATVERAPVNVEVRLIGFIEPQRTAEIRARVDGIVEKLLYTEGSDVEAGAPLFQIDDRDIQAQLKQAQSVLQRALAVEKNTAQVESRFRPLVRRQAISAQEYDAALAAHVQAQAAVTDARASVTLAQLRLERCTVRAPISGRVGRALVTEGALVSGASATLLTQINQLSPISATFTKSSSEILDLTEALQTGALSRPENGKFSVSVTLPNNREYAERGIVDFADLVVNRSTGAQTIRAQFQNTDRALLPGQFVRGRFHVGVRQEAVLVPSRAVQMNNGLATVLVVGPENTVQPRQLELGEQQEGNWVVHKGLDTGDRVVVDGWHKVRPGQQVAVSDARAN